MLGRGGGCGGIGANWAIYPGWLDVVPSNYDLPLEEILPREIEAITGQPVDPGGDG
jgi:hypothetical protein